MKKVLIIALCLIMVLSLVACGAKKEEAAAPAEKEEAAAPAEKEEVAAPEEGDAAAEPVKIYFIPKNLGNPYFESISLGFEKAIAEFPAGTFEYEMVGPATAEATSQIEYVEAAVQNGADVIFIAANSNDALNGTFDDAEEAGTRIVIINQDIPGSEDHRTASVQPVDMTKVGVALCDHVKELIGEGKFAVLSATTDAPDQNQWIADMEALLASDSKYAGLELVEVVYGDDQPEKSTTEMEALLAKHTDLDCVVAPTTVGIAAAAKVLQTKGNKAEDGIKLTGLGLPSEMAEFVLDGTVSEFKLWNPPLEGYLGVYMAYEMTVNGYEPEAGSTFKAGELGDVTVSDNSIIFAIPDLMVYNIDNIEEYAAQF